MFNQKVVEFYQKCKIMGITVEYTMRGKPTEEQIQSITKYLIDTYKVQPQIQDNRLKLKVDGIIQSTSIINNLSSKFPFLFEIVPLPYSYVSSLFGWPGER